MTEPESQPQSQPQLPPHHEERFTEGHWSKLLESIDLAIVQEAIACHVPLFQDSAIERVLQRDALVCGNNNPAAFEKLRSLLVMHYSVCNEMTLELGGAETATVAASVREHLQGRIGNQLR